MYTIFNVSLRVGGVRRINIPPNMAFVDGVGDDKPGPMPYGRDVLTMPFNDCL